MAMATTALTPSLQRNKLLQGVRSHPHQPAGSKVFSPTSLLRSISAKVKQQDNVNHQQEQMMSSTSTGASMLLAGAFFSALATSQTASAAQQIMELAATSSESDSRGLALLVPLVPALGWVLYNILQPALNQFNRMKSVKGTLAAIGLGLGGASFAFSQHASAGDIPDIAAAAADNDSRGLILLGVLLPAIGWVLFNILQPGLNQLDKMRSSSKAMVGALGLSAASYAYFAEEADAAAQEVATIAEGDNRGLLLLLVILPAIGWVLFNILQPALNQLNKMKSEK